jgi:hypothetical protein
MQEKKEKSNSFNSIHNTIFEWHWDAMSHIVTPSMVKKILIASDEASYEYFKRVKGSVMLRMYQSAVQRFQHLMHQGVSVQEIWESYLSPEGYIPVCIPKNIISNERFGFKNEQNQWKEWNIVSLQVIRMYWDNIFSQIGYKIHSELRDICRKLIQTLPGPFSTCECCTWSIPVSEMATDFLCTYCQDYKKYPKIELQMTDSGVPYIKYPVPINTKPVLKIDIPMTVNSSCSLEYRTKNNLIQQMQNLNIRDKQ